MRRLTSRLIALIQAQGALAHCFSCLAGDLAADEPAVRIAAQALLGLRPKPCVISIRICTGCGKRKETLVSA
jgi:hypothetical protein